MGGTTLIDLPETLSRLLAQFGGAASAVFMVWMVGSWVLVNQLRNRPRREALSTVQFWAETAVIVLVILIGGAWMVAAVFLLRLHGH